MGRTLEQSAVDPTHLEFFGLTQPPFAHSSEPSQLFHSEQYSVLMEKLFNATTKNDSLVVVCGANGSGKSTQLKRFVSSVDDSIYCVVIDESCHGEEQFYTAFLTQIGFSDITGTANELKNITKEFIVCRGIAGDHILITIDNAHLTDPTILDQLRQLCEIKVKDRRVLSVVLAGNTDIIRVIDAPAMRQTRFRNHVVFTIRNYSEAETESYVWHRLKSAGGSNAVKISAGANALIHRYSGGNPHLINTLCNEMLAEGYRLKSRVITEEMVRSAADKQQLLPHVISFHGRGRRKTDPDFNPMRSVSDQSSVNVKDLNQQAAELSAQLDDLLADKAKALQERDAKQQEVEALRGKLAGQAKEVRKLSLFLGRSADEIGKLKLALTDRETAIQDSERKFREVAAELQNEIVRRQETETELASAMSAAESARQAQQELQATLDRQAHADRQTAKEQAANSSANEKLTASLSREIDKQSEELISLRAELDARDEAIANLEEQLDQSLLNYEQAKSRSKGLINPEELKEIEEASRGLAAELAKEVRARRAADKKLANATQTIDELSQVNRDLHVEIDELQADLETSLNATEERGIEIAALETITAGLEKDVQAKAGELELLRDKLESSKERYSDIEAQLGDAHAQLESAQVAIGKMVPSEELHEASAALSDLRSEMEHEVAARKDVEKELSKTSTRFDELSLQNKELLETVHGLNADLAAAGERAIDVYVLEQKVRDLKDEIDALSRELDSRNRAFADIEKQLAALQEENELLRQRAAAAEKHRDAPSVEHTERPTDKKRKHSSRVVEMFEHSIRNVDAYRALRKFDPDFYEDLIATYKRLVGQGLSDKQVNDALRSKQVEKMQRLLPQASDNAIVAYARLIVDQLDELQLHGTEPCLTFLVPRPDPKDQASLAFSEQMKDRELDVLYKTLKSYKPGRPAPSQDDVWPDLGPVFSDLIKAFGAEYVAALENSFDPDIDRVLACNVSRALYSGILGFSKRNAANAIRWLMSS